MLGLGLAGALHGLHHVKRQPVQGLPAVGGPTGQCQALDDAIDLVGPAPAARGD